MVSAGEAGLVMTIALSYCVGGGSQERGGGGQRQASRRAGDAAPAPSSWIIITPVQRTQVLFLF